MQCMGPATIVVTLIVGVFLVLGALVFSLGRQQRRTHARVCSSCGERNPSSARFCARCGHALNDGKH